MLNMPFMGCAGTRNSTNYCSGIYQLQVTNTFQLSGSTYVCGCNTGKQATAKWATGSTCPSGTAASPRICLSGVRTLYRILVLLVLQTLPVIG